MLDTRSGIILASVMGLTLSSWTMSGAANTERLLDEKQTVTLTGDAERPDKATPRNGSPVRVEIH